MERQGAPAVLPGVRERIRAPGLLLVGGRAALDAQTAVRADIEIRMGCIRSITTPSKTPPPNSKARPNQIIDLSGYLILPGLINAHDHLEFNLFPRLGNGPYPNYEAWATDIYRPDQAPLREHLSVPEAVRLWWGGLKNLLAGVTTVCHHNPYVKEVFEADFPVRVVKRFAWSHSLAFGKDVQGAFASAGTDVPFIIHLGEGADDRAAEEIFILHRLGVLDSRTVIVHGVGLESAGYKLLRSFNAALVWCPTSNLFTLRKTLDPQRINGSRRIALGNDSALTAQGDLFDEIAYARRFAGLSPQRIYSLVTDSAADVLRLRRGEGKIRAGAPADLIAMEEKGKSPAETLVEAQFGKVEFVMLAGEPILMSPAISGRWSDENRMDFEPLTVGGSLRYVRAPVDWLAAEAKRHLGNRICLAGKPVEV